MAERAAKERRLQASDATMQENGEPPRVGLPAHGSGSGDVRGRVRDNLSDGGRCTAAVRPAMENAVNRGERRLNAVWRRCEKVPYISRAAHGNHGFACVPEPCRVARPFDEGSREPLRHGPATQGERALTRILAMARPFMNVSLQFFAPASATHGRLPRIFRGSFDHSPDSLCSIRQTLRPYLRKGYDGLFGLVKTGLGRDPLSGDLFLFVNTRQGARVGWHGAHEAVVSRFAGLGFRNRRSLGECLRSHRHRH